MTRKTTKKAQHCINSLVSPKTKKQLYLKGEHLTSSDNSERYPLKEGIVMFLNEKEHQFYDNYYSENFQPNRYSSTPPTPHNYYTRFTDGWNTMLDLGCGYGTMSASSAHKVKHIYCVEPSRVALLVLQKRGKENMYPICAKGDSLPFMDNFFDGIFNIFVIEHIKNPTPMLSEIHRVLKPKGKLVIGTDTAFYYKYLRIFTEWKSKGWKKWKPNDPTHVNLMNPNKLRRYLEKSGFTILEEHIHFFKGKIRKFFGWVPFCLWETLFNSSFVFVCSPNK